MKKILFFFLIMITFSLTFGQAVEISKYDPGSSNDPNNAWYNEMGVRAIWVADDMDNDGKQEILATDYSNGGRIHVLEMNGNNELSIVFSTPVIENNTNNGSTPRWVRTGDLDGDGNKEFIFSLTWNGADSLIQVWEYNGRDNGYGFDSQGKPSFQLNAKELRIPLGIGDFRTNRENASVYDWDGDGRDELIMANRDHGVYILGVVNSFPGFANWIVEGGLPDEVDNNRWSGGSWWHSIPADIDGDGTKEIVNHYWNYFGFWAIEPTGPDSYAYPASSNPNAYHEYTERDAVSYMGVYAADVDGNGKDEVVGVGYSEFYKIGLLSLPRGTDVLDGFTADNRFNWISDGFWPLAGFSSGSHWGINAGDLDMDGRAEIYVGGQAEYNITQMKYTGQSEDDGGDVLDPANYDNKIIYTGSSDQYFNMDIYDSAGVAVDTISYESPFVAKIYAGSDLNNNGYRELVVAYQSVVDSINVTRYTWNDAVQDYRQSGFSKVPSTNTANIRVIEWGQTNVPVELTTFNAELNNNVVNLTWQTATEKNNQGFEIERSVDEKHWKMIGFVEGNGTTTDKQTYSFTDDKPAAGVSWYRLKQTDYDGTYEYSQSIELNASLPQRFNLSQNYPNPFNPSTRIAFSLPQSGHVRLDLFNPLGELVAKISDKDYEAGKHEVGFNGSHLSSGIYYYNITVKTESGKTFKETKKLVLVK